MDANNTLHVRVERRGHKYIWALHRDGHFHPVKFSAARVAVLVSPIDIMNTQPTLRDVETAARAIGLHIQVFNASTSREIDDVFEILGRERPDALFVGANPFFNERRVQLAQLAAFHRLPATYALREVAEVGGLMSYGSDIVDA